MQTNTTPGLLPVRIPTIGASNLIEVDRFVPDDFLARRAAAKRARSHRIYAEKHDRRVMLKIKLIDLAQEARTIRREELLRQGGWLRTELHAHRTGGLRLEARCTHLAYGFLRGRARAKMERKPAMSEWWQAVHDAPIRARVSALVKKYGPAGAAVPEEWFTE